MRTSAMCLTLGLLACSEPISPDRATRIAPPTHATLATVVKTIENGVGAIASFAAADGCVVTETRVSVVRDQAPGSTPTVLFDQNVFDACTGQPLDRVDGLGSTATFSGNLTTAALNGTVGRNSNGDVFDIPIVLTWTGTGSTTKANTVTVQSDGGTRTVLKLKAATRAATVAGLLGSQVVGEDGVLALGTLLSSVQGTISITR